MEQPAIDLNKQPPEDGIIDLTLRDEEDDDDGFNTGTGFRFSNHCHMFPWSCINIFSFVSAQVGVPQEFDLNSFPQEFEDGANIDFDLNALPSDEEHANFNGGCFLYIYFHISVSSRFVSS